MRAPCMNVFGWVMSLILKVSDKNKPTFSCSSNSDGCLIKQYQGKETEEMVKKEWLYLFCFTLVRLCGEDMWGNGL